VEALVTEPCLLSLAEAARRIADGRLSARALVESCLARIARLEPVIAAWVALDPEGARAAAEEADRAIRAGRVRGPLHGIPYGLKDILRTREFSTRAATRLPIGADEGPEAQVHRRLRDAGAILLGKLSTYELGTGSGASYDDLPLPPARNPWNPDHFTGGSSTGAGAAVAARMVPFAIGTDTGGSVRLPAAGCGVVGLKATYGRISRIGMLPNCPSQDHVGPLARTVEDAGTVLAVLAEPGRPGLPDLGGAATPGAYGSESRGPALWTPEGSPAGGGATPPTIAVVRDFHSSDPVASAAIANGLEGVVETLARAGARIIERPLPCHPRDLRACGRIVNAVESFAIHRRWLEHTGAVMGTALRDKLESATEIGAADYVDALRWRRALSQALHSLIDGCDALLCAGTMTTAPRLDDEVGCIAFSGESAMSGFSLSGMPALSLPVGFGPDGLPLNVQLAARPYEEAGLLQVAHLVEMWLERSPHPPPEPSRAPGEYTRPVPAPDREGRKARITQGMREMLARIPRPLPDTLESALGFLPPPPDGDPDLR
jgi:aspartyl-tRNA(Asn)/glutamyl-tRNA(Gln) amidotransferase subunit A